jgi:3-oxoadipate enol-lactonase
MITTEPRSIELGTHATRVVVSGAGEPVFVCLHGLVDDLDIWDLLAPGLENRGTVVRYDQRGHGGADAPPGPYSRDDLADDAIAVLDRLEIERAVLVGHSMGGIMAMTAALSHPERVAGLVLIGTTSQASGRAASWYTKIADAGVADGIDGLTRTIYGPDADRVVSGDPVGIAEVTRTLAQLHLDPLTPHLGAVPCPALLVVGEHDPLGARATEICARGLPDATVEFVDGVGHWVHVQAPDRILDAYDEWSDR